MCILISSFANPFAYGELLASRLSIDEPPLPTDEPPLSIHEPPLSIHVPPLSIHEAPLSIYEPPLSIDESPIAFSVQHFPNHFYLQVEINFIPLSV